MKPKILTCEVCSENKPYTEGKWGRYSAIWVCNPCRDKNDSAEGEDEDEEEWFDDDGIDVENEEGEEENG